MELIKIGNRESSAAKVEETTIEHKKRQ
jgi:hypothetical protein